MGEAVTGIDDLFAEFSQPDAFHVQAQLELWGWREREAARERERLRYAILKSSPALRQARNEYHRSRSAGRRDYWRDQKRSKRGTPKYVYHCGACGEVGHRVTTCAARRAA